MNEDILTKPVGNKEPKKLGAKNVTVIHARIDEKGEKKNKILILSCKHPEQDDLLELSKVQLIDGKSVKTVGLWVNLDEDENIQKGSALASFMTKFGINQLTELKDKELPTTFDEKGYLVIKAY